MVSVIFNLKHRQLIFMEQQRPVIAKRLLILSLICGHVRRIKSTVHSFVGTFGHLGAA